MHLYDLADFEESKDRAKWKEGKDLGRASFHILKSAREREIKE